MLRRLHRLLTVVGSVANAAGAGLRMLLAAMLLAASAVALAGCANQVNKHGHHFSDTDIQQVQPGMTKEQVRVALGTPDTVSSTDGATFYYISSTTKGAMFMSPKEVDRRVLAVYFNPVGTVDRVAHYGLKDGKVFDFISRTTQSHARDETLVKQLFRNLGKGSIFNQ